MTVGLLLRCDKTELPIDAGWKPESSGARKQVISVVRQAIGHEGKEGRTEAGEKVHRFIYDSAKSHLEIDIPVEEETASVAVRGIFADDARTVLRSLCGTFRARYYDSESGFSPL